MPKFLLNTTLHQRQSRYYNGYYCPYCNLPCDFIDSKEVYQQSYGMIFICRPCRAWVNVHHQHSDQSFGFVAKKDLRDLRHLAHQKFDPLWQLKVTAGANKKTAQSQARKWLAVLLNIDIVECHIGMMDNARCKQVISICEEVYIDLEIKKLERENNTKINVEAVYFLQKDLNDIYTVQEHKINTLHLLTLTHTVSGFILKIKPKEQLYSVPGVKEKWLTLESIETLIFKYFKTDKANG